MSSAAATRASSHNDRRANGTADPDRSRPRMSGAGGHANPASAGRTGPSPQPQTSSHYAGTSHKRSASGNPRPISRAAEERRVDERKTQRTYVTEVETVVRRTRSPERQERRPVQTERSRASETGKQIQRPLETRPREPSKPDTPQGKYINIYTTLLLSIVPVTRSIR
jgi:gamma-tubulin complex component 2